MKIVLNGEPKELDTPLTIQQLLDQLSIPAGRVACELNLKIVKRGLFPQTPLHEGDTVEIIQAIGGG
jgi:thiamine biosynthesis protein ThiS